MTVAASNFSELWRVGGVNHDPVEVAMVECYSLQGVGDPEGMEPNVEFHHPELRRLGEVD